MNRYLKLKEVHQREVNDFPMFFAFNNQQLDEGMEKMGVKDTKELCTIPGGGFIKKTDTKAFGDMLLKHSKDRQTAVDNDKTGEGFVLQMFRYELDNHEFNYTYDVDPTLDALGITRTDIKENETLQHGLHLAMMETGRV